MGYRGFLMAGVLALTADRRAARADHLFTCPADPTASLKPYDLQSPYVQIVPSGGHQCSYDWECGLPPADMASRRTDALTSTGSCAGAEVCRARTQATCTFPTGLDFPKTCVWSDADKTCKGMCECARSVLPNGNLGQPMYGCSNCMVKLAPVGAPCCAGPPYEDNTPQGGGQCKHAADQTPFNCPHCCVVPTGPPNASLAKDPQYIVGPNATAGYYAGMTNTQTSTFLPFLCQSAWNNATPVETCQRQTPSGTGALTNCVDQCSFHGGPGYGPQIGAGNPQGQKGKAYDNPDMGDRADCTVGHCQYGVCDGDVQCSSQWQNGPATGYCVATSKADPSGPGKCVCIEGNGCDRCSLMAKDLQQGAQCGDWVVGGAGCSTDKDCNYEDQTSQGGSWAGGKCVQGVCKCNSAAKLPASAQGQYDAYVCGDCSRRRSLVIQAPWRAATDLNPFEQCPCTQPSPGKPPGLYCTDPKDKTWGVPEFSMKLISPTKRCTVTWTGSGQGGPGDVRKCDPKDPKVNYNNPVFHDQGADDGDIASGKRTVFAATCSAADGKGNLGKASAVWAGVYHIVSSKTANYIARASLDKTVNDTSKNLTNFDAANHTYSLEVPHSVSASNMHVQVPNGCEGSSAVYLNVTYNASGGFTPPKSQKCTVDADCWVWGASADGKGTRGGGDQFAWPDPGVPQAQRRLVATCGKDNYCTPQTRYFFNTTCTAASQGKCSSDLNVTLWYPQGHTVVSVLVVPNDCLTSGAWDGACANSQRGVGVYKFTVDWLVVDYDGTGWEAAVSTPRCK
eukprot:g6883.t1